MTRISPPNIFRHFLPQDDHRPALGCGVALCNRLTLDESTGVSGSTISLIRTTDGGRGWCSEADLIQCYGSSPLQQPAGCWHTATGSQNPLSILWNGELERSSYTPLVQCMLQPGKGGHIMTPHMCPVCHVCTALARLVLGHSDPQVYWTKLCGRRLEECLRTPAAEGNPAWAELVIHIDWRCRLLHLAPKDLLNQLPPCFFLWCLNEYPLSLTCIHE
jgi:hypothetical protein